MSSLSKIEVTSHILSYYLFKLIPLYTHKIYQQCKAKSRFNHIEFSHWIESSRYPPLKAVQTKTSLDPVASSVPATRRQFVVAENEIASKTVAPPNYSCKFHNDRTAPNDEGWERVGFGHKSFWVSVSTGWNYNRWAKIISTIICLPCSYIIWGQRGIFSSSRHLVRKNHKKYVYKRFFFRWFFVSLRWSWVNENKLITLRTVSETNVLNLFLVYLLTSMIWLLKFKILLFTKLSLFRCSNRKRATLAFI